LIACSDDNTVSNDEDTDGDPTPETEEQTDSGDPDDSMNEETDSGVSETSARYQVTFNATWSSDTHPENFPPNPHFSPLIGAIHNEQVIFWETGQPASEGIETMAETGGTSTFQTEINDAIANGYATTLISEGGIAESPAAIVFEIAVDRDYPLITLTSMVAPSPDWFVGIHNFSLVVDGSFVDAVTVELPVYDSGTDSGANYVSANSDTQPPEPISLLTSNPGDSPFINGLPIAGNFVFEKL
ncbi:MAG: spondin domain-containing protein, partial [Gammaproteobacteria bacterium]|nr:spondin domain-containing protein [Gammaproteobacteria bacterium]